MRAALPCLMLLLLLPLPRPHGVTVSLPLLLLLLLLSPWGWSPLIRGPLLLPPWLIWIPRVQASARAW